MPEAHTVGRLFWHKIRLQPNAPRHHRYETREYEYPYRWADSHVFRLSRRSGIVVGWWRGGEMDEETEEYAVHLYRAFQGREITSNAEAHRPIAVLFYTLITGVDT